MNTRLPNELLEQRLIVAQQQLYTLRDWMRLGVSLFNEAHLYYGHGTTNAHDEVVSLIMHGLHLNDLDITIYLDAKLLDYEINIIQNYFKQRINLRMPAPYITHQAILFDHSFYVDKRVIIPRSFIPELLHQQQFEYWIKSADVDNILDLCTGNGSIAVFAAYAFPDSHILATDIDGQALAVAKINLEQYALTKQVILLQSNLWENIPSDTKFDIILANPPYIDKWGMDNLPPEYLHEPQHALTGGITGLELVTQIIDQAPNFLSAHGVLIVEIGDSISQIESLYPQLEFTWLSTSNDEGRVFLLTAQQLITQTF